MLRYYVCAAAGNEGVCAPWLYIYVRPVAEIGGGHLVWLRWVVVVRYGGRARARLRERERVRDRSARAHPFALLKSGVLHVCRCPCVPALSHSLSLVLVIVGLTE